MPLSFVFSARVMSMSVIVTHIVLHIHSPPTWAQVDILGAPWPGQIWRSVRFGAAYMHGARHHRSIAPVTKSVEGPSDPLPQL